MIIDEIGRSKEQSRDALRAAFVLDEAAAVGGVLAAIDIDPEQVARITARAADLVRRVRAAPKALVGVEAFLQEYSLSSTEGVALMCLAEALLRVPDAATADLLIKDKLAAASWHAHRGRSASGVVNTATMALMLTGRVLGEGKSFGERAVSVLGGPLIRRSAVAAMRVLGGQFVMGRTMAQALARAKKPEARGYRHSYDMLGEAARTASDAGRYARRYHEAILAIGARGGAEDIVAKPSISVKLSALHPRYEEAHRGRVWAELLPRVRELAILAKQHGIGFTIDAEESDRLDLSLDLIEVLSGDPGLGDWDGFGVAVQAYQTRALAVVDHLTAMAARHRRRLTVRLVKGAYWDGEIKRAQDKGLDRYPVFTRKIATDASYIACATKLLAARESIYPAFATHNARTVATILELAGERDDWEFQRLYGMGEALHDAVLADPARRIACRVYAPVGGHEDLLAYLVRRLLENGANSSFIHRLADPATPVEAIVADPVARLRACALPRHPGIPLPADLFGPSRRNSQGIDLADEPALREIADAIRDLSGQTIDAYPLTGDPRPARPGEPVRNPANLRGVIGSVVAAEAVDIDVALDRAVKAMPGWDAAGVAVRAQVLRTAADLLEARRPVFASLIMREGGRTLANALDEIREAVDFCRYYAAEAERQFGAMETLPRPAGESNRYGLAGRGVFVCISPWNFPLAIFIGQIAAALTAGNAVVAKPAEQTPLTAFTAVRLLHDAGVPEHVLHFLPGNGDVGARLVADPRISGVAFTGSTIVARSINRSLAAREGSIIPFIAETGGINVMIADATALPEQITADVLRSAFDSAGQRCSALRLLYLQEEIADAVTRMIAGAMAELKVGDPMSLSSDIGPVIDQDARRHLTAYIASMRDAGHVVITSALPEDCADGVFIAPAIIEVESVNQVPHEIFGPVLHVARWRSGELDAIIDAVNASGYGLTLGIHSRIDATIKQIAGRTRVGNIYVNRTMIGAVVGVQPFGGEGLSGTGPKAGGPRYLARFAVERSISVNTAATGGNVALLTLGDEDDA